MKTDVDRFVANAVNIIHNEKSREHIIELLKKGKPPEALSDATLQVLKMTEMVAQKKGVEIDDQIRIDGGMAIMELLIEVAEAADIFEPTEEIVAKAAQLAVGKYYKSLNDQGNLTAAMLNDHAEQAKQRLAQQGQPQGELQPQPDNTATQEMEEPDNVNG